ncbi:MAG: B12-binding domain-containing radical SAM protein [Acidobacteriia bacterium]|nr:B12-binding domain-containing radical SAM protein [Terriglobia bacterium]
MILFYNPKAARFRNRRLPLSILSIAAVIEGKEDYAIVDGNLDPHPTETLLSHLTDHSVELVAVTVMPGPQTVGAVASCREIRARFPHVPIVWGGYFASNYTPAVLNAPYVDFAVRGQGESTFLELLDAIRGRRDFKSIQGLSYKGVDGKAYHNPERPMRGLDEFPWYPYQRIPTEKYLLPTFLGRRTAVHQASIGCPYRCNFCGVVTFSGSREKMESPARTEKILRHLAESYGVDAVQFYDNNFFLREDHTRELADRLAGLKLRWWCEGRTDIMMRYSDATLESLRRAGCTMIFFGAESGSNQNLKEMNKDLCAEDTLALASRIRRFDIIPEFSIIFGNPKDPEGDTRDCIRFIRQLKRLNPKSEIIVEHYTPVPQRARMYGGVEDKIQFPTTPDEWATDRWQRFATQKDPQTPWLRPRTKRLIDDFELVVSSRWPTVQDIRLPSWGRLTLKALSSWRYRLGIYSAPIELKWVQQFINLRRPKAESL